jgi:fatty-acyl-CoA synthase
MSRLTDGIAEAAANSPFGLHFGAAVALRFASWRDIHRTAARVAGRLAAEGVVRGSRVGVLAANPEDVAPVVQGIWRAGAAMTMLQQPTPQTDLAEWHAGTLRVLTMLGALCRCRPAVLRGRRSAASVRISGHRDPRGVA